MTAAVIPGIPREVRCWLSAAFKRVATCPDSPPVLASVPAGGSTGSSDALTTVGEAFGEVAGVAVGGVLGVGVGVGEGVAVGAGLALGVGVWTGARLADGVSARVATAVVGVAVGTSATLVDAAAEG